MTSYHKLYNLPRNPSLLSGGMDVALLRPSQPLALCASKKDQCLPGAKRAATKKLAQKNSLTKIFFENEYLKKHFV